MPGNDPIPAILDQLAAHHEQLTQLSRTLEDHAAVLTELASAASADADPDGYHPNRPRSGGPSRPTCEQDPSPGCAPGSSRSTGLATATSLAPCWEAHDLCLYGLDIAASLWSVLYLQPLRTPGLISAQAEYQARILPALAEQFRIETSLMAARSVIRSGPGRDLRRSRPGMVRPGSRCGGSPAGSRLLFAGCGGYPAASAGTRVAALGVPRPVTGSQPLVAG